MNLNLNQLRIFWFCGKHSTFSEAADALCLSQPAVTVQIKQLENSCGIDLIQRHKKRIELTDAGRMLFDYAEQIFRLTESAENSIKTFKDKEAGTLKIGTVKLYSRFIIPPIKLYFQRKFPGRHVDVSEGAPAEIVRNLLEKKIELGLISLIPPYPPRLNIIPYSQEEMYLILSHDHPLNSKRKILIKDLAGQGLVVKQKASTSKDVILAKYREAGIEPGTLIEVDNIASILDEVQAGRGISFIAEYGISSERAQYGKGVSFVGEWAFKEQIERGALHLRSIADQRFFINIVITHLKDTNLSPAAAAFIDLLLERKGTSTNS